MHPLLFEVRLASGRLPLGPTLGVLAALALLLAFFGWRRELREALVTGVAAALAAGLGALIFRSQNLELASLPVPAFGTLLALAFGLGGAVTLRLAHRDGLARDAALAGCIAAAVGGILGARLLYALLHPHELGALTAVVAFRQGGLAAHGGLIGGVLGVWLVGRRRPLPLLRFLDAAAPALGVGVAVTRVGCWLEGCDFGSLLARGAPTWLGRLGTFPAQSPAWTAQVLEQRLAPSALASLPVHPAELYEAAGGIVLALVALAARRRQREQGTAAVLALLGYVLLRVFVDLSRDSSSDVWFARAAALGGMAGAALLWRRSLAERRSHVG